MSTTFESSSNNEEAFKNNLNNVIAKLQQIDGKRMPTALSSALSTRSRKLSPSTA